MNIHQSLRLTLLGLLLAATAAQAQTPNAPADTIAKSSRAAITEAGGDPR